MTDLPLPEIDLPDPAPKPPFIPADPFKVPDGPVGHEQILWALIALKASIDDLLTRLIGVEEKQKLDSQALEKALAKWDAIGHAVSAISTIQRNLADEELEQHARESYPDRDAAPAPPELDADERTTPGYRVPNRDERGDE